MTEGIVSAFREAVQEDSSVTLPMVSPNGFVIATLATRWRVLVDIEGRVIGIPTLAATDPSSEVAPRASASRSRATSSGDIAGQIVAKGKVFDSHRAFLGVRVGDTNGNGVLVGAVTAGGAAARAECTSAT